MFITTVVLAFLAGVAVTLLVQWSALYHWFSRLSTAEPHFKPQYSKFRLPEEILLLLQNTNLQKETESCNAMNLILQFLFRELKETKKFRRWVIKKISLELEELLQKTTTGKLLEQITVRDFNVGDTFPIIKSVSVMNVQLHKQKHQIEELDVMAEVSYAGGFQLSIDVDMVFGKTAFLSVKVTCLQGKARLRLTREPYTHWSFSFYEEPKMDFNVESQFQGRPIPQVTNLIISQLRRTVRKKHTLPNYKMRYKPFFMKPDERRLHVADVNLLHTRICVGNLEVTVLECSRIVKTHPNAKIYCTLAIDKDDWIELVSSTYGAYITFDTEVIKTSGQQIGIILKKEFYLDKYEEQVVVDTVLPYTPAANADIRKGDILVSVNGLKVTSTKHAVKLLANASERCAMRLERESIVQSSSSMQDMPSRDADDSSLRIKDTDNISLGSRRSALEVEEAAEELLNITMEEQASKPQVAQTSLSRDRQAAVAAGGRKALTFLSQKTGLFQRQKQVVGETPMCASTAIASAKKDSPKKMIASQNDTLTLPESLEPPVDGSTRTRRRSCPDASAIVTSYSTDNFALISSEVSDRMQKSGVDLRKTSYVAAAQDIEWNERFVFNVCPDHRYLNVCVWCKNPERTERTEKFVKPEKDILLGHQTVALTDIALECALTRSATFQDSYSLLPPELRPGASRSKNLSQHPGFDPSLCYGDITLAFQHGRLRDDQSDDSATEDDAGEDTIVIGSQAEIPPSDQELRGKHDFIGTQFHSSTACHFCGKRIWLKVAFQCRACAMICHKKCLLRCQSQTVCSSLRARNQTSAAPAACISTGGITQPPPVVIATHADDVSPVTSSAESTPLDTPMDSPVMRRRRVPSMGSLLAEVVPERITRSGSFCSLTPPDRRRNISKSLPPSPLCSPITKRKTFLPVPLVKREDSTEEEIQQAIHKLMAIQGNDPNSELLASAAKEMGKELHCNLPQEERKQKLNNRILQLQEEMKKETDHQEDVRRSRRGVTDPRAQEQLKEAARKSDDKVQALALMLLHYCSGLQACLAQEHPEDKDAAAMKDKDAAAVKDKDAAAMKDKDAAAMKDKDAAAVKDKDAAAMKDGDAASVKDKDAAAVKDKDAAAVKDKDAAAMKDKDAAAMKDGDAASVKDKDAAAVKDKDAAAVKDKDAAAVKDGDAAAVKDKDAAAVKDEDAAAVKDEDAGVGDENTVFHDAP